MQSRAASSGYFKQGSAFLGEAMKSLEFWYQPGSLSCPGPLERFVFQGKTEPVEMN